MELIFSITGLGISSLFISSLFVSSVACLSVFLFVVTLLFFLCIGFIFVDCVSVFLFDTCFSSFNFIFFDSISIFLFDACFSSFNLLLVYIAVPNAATVAVVPIANVVLLIPFLLIFLIGFSKNVDLLFFDSFRIVLILSIILSILPDSVNSVILINILFNIFDIWFALSIYNFL